jgi:hypothetical protein
MKTADPKTAYARNLVSDVWQGGAMQEGNGLLVTARWPR